MDVIIVLGGDTGRVEQGVALYQLGYADKILFTGAFVANNMSRQAQALGVPADRLLVEDRALTTFENAKYTLEIMKTKGLKSAIIVTSPYHTKRARLIFEHFYRGLELTVCSVPYNSTMSNTWWKNRGTAYPVLSEYIKLAWYYIVERW